MRQICSNKIIKSINVKLFKMFSFHVYFDLRIQKIVPWNMRYRNVSCWIQINHYHTEAIWISAVNFLRFISLPPLCVRIQSTKILKEWGLRNLVDFKLQQPRQGPNILKSPWKVVVLWTTLTDSLPILGMSVSSEVSYAEYVRLIAKKTPKTCESIQSQEILSSGITADEVQLRVQIEYSSHIWRNAPQKFHR